MAVNGHGRLFVITLNKHVSSSKRTTLALLFYISVRVGPLTMNEIHNLKWV